MLAWSWVARGKLTKCHPFLDSVSVETWSYLLTCIFALGGVTKPWKATVEFGLYRVDYLQGEGYGEDVWGLSDILPGEYRASFQPERSFQIDETESVAL